MKSQHELGAYESHVVLTEERAKDMLKNGFNMNEFFKDKNIFVTFKASLDNYRVSTPFKDGVLFFDECHYDGIVDYEIEYEVNHYQEGYKTFLEFLKEENIPYVKTLRKSVKALSRLNK